ncbi:MAG TPA: ATP-binding cassette domain-containing protein, partial [Acidobacteriaceae bacterium]|nr:ATP-binding cassette domain-containing protein [Acidobacteriaceae bacterium]
LQPTSGTVKRATNLRITYFEQNRQLDESQTLRRALAPHGDSIIYQDRVIHVASWAARFLFTGEQLNQPVSHLSGGERARVLIAQLMLQPADLLLLDEPTNDLDIPTLEILEETLLEYPGALVLVTHDRYMLDRIANIVVGLDGEANAATFADYQQWEAWMEAQEQSRKSAPSPESKPTPTTPPQPSKKKLSYLEAREWATLEDRIAEAEESLRQARATLEDPSVATDAARLQTALAEAEAAQQSVDALFTRWAELEEKQK